MPMPPCGFDDSPIGNELRNLAIKSSIQDIVDATEEKYFELQKAELLPKVLVPFLKGKGIEESYLQTAHFIILNHDLLRHEDLALIFSDGDWKSFQIYFERAVTEIELEKLTRSALPGISEEVVRQRPHMMLLESSPVLNRPFPSLTLAILEKGYVAYIKPSAESQDLKFTGITRLLNYKPVICHYAGDVMQCGFYIRRSSDGKIGWAQFPIFPIENKVALEQFLLKHEAFVELFK